MTPELAKQLKYAGSPQGLPDDGKHYPSEAPTVGEDGILKVHPGPYAPTLSEFIEACGKVEDIDLRRRFVGGEYGMLWTGELTQRKDGKVNLFIGCGVTPEEAAAKLWLALNKK